MANDPAMLQAALVGYQQQLDQIDRAIADLRKRIGGRGPVAARAVPAGRRQLSPAARRRIAAAQKKRWAAFRKNQKSK
jgi:hypothetical protein